MSISKDQAEMLGHPHEVRSGTLSNMTDKQARILASLNPEVVNLLVHALLTVDNALLLRDVNTEMQRQRTLWGSPDRKPAYWLGLSREWLVDTAKAFIDLKGGRVLTKASVREEAVRTAASLVLFIEWLDQVDSI